MTKSLFPTEAKCYIEKRQPVPPKLHYHGEVEMLLLLLLVLSVLDQKILQNHLTGKLATGGVYKECFPMASGVQRFTYAT